MVKKFLEDTGMDVEDPAYRRNVENFSENTAKTKTGKRLLGEVFAI